MLVGFVRLVGGELDASLGAGVSVFNGLAVGGRQFIELVHAVADRFGLALHILFAGERIDASPEAFAGRRGQRRFAGRIAVGRSR